MPDNSEPISRAVQPQNVAGTEHERQKTLRKAIAASAMGNFTEWFDYGVYATTSAYLTQAFFPELGTLGTAMGFAISFLFRPLGGFIWGPLGDRLGRKAVLATTILLMAAATALIGVLPTYAQVGVLAPALLFLLRIIQGFSTGGEYGGAATFMAEYSPDKKRGFFGSFLEFGTLCGTVAGSAVVLLLQVILTSEEMYSWGWRIPFFIAIPLGFVGWYLRNQLDETPVFEEMDQSEQEAQGSAWDRFVSLLRDYQRPIIVMFGLVIALNVSYYTLLAYMPTYLYTTIGLTETDATTLLLVGQIVMAALIPFFGALSDRTGRKPLWYVSLIGLALLAVPMFWLMGQGFWWAMLGFVVLGLLFIPQLATISATFPAMFPTQVRYAGFAISYNVATAAFGGTAPLVNDAIVGATEWHLFPAFYMVAACVIGLIAMPFLIETKGCSIRGTEVPGPDTEATKQSRLEDAGKVG